jgi:thiamine biosynthesis lipoprotein
VTAAAGPGRPDVTAAPPLARVALRDAAMSVSAVWGRAFLAGGRVLGHVLDPRRGAPVEGAVMSAVVTPSATDSDALSTALLVLGRPGLDLLCGRCPEVQGLVVDAGPDAGVGAVAARGDAWLDLTD